MKIISISKIRKLTKVTLILSESEWKQFSVIPITEEEDNINSLREYSSKIIENILVELGIKTTLAGYEYLKECISYFQNKTNCNPSKIKLKKELYPYVATKFPNTTSAKVERAINYAVRASWEKANPDVLKEILGSKKKNRPKSKELIKALAIYIRSDNF